MDAKSAIGAAPRGKFLQSDFVGELGPAQLRDSGTGFAKEKEILLRQRCENIGTGRGSEDVVGQLETVRVALVRRSNAYAVILGRNLKKSAETIRAFLEQ